MITTCKATGKMAQMDVPYVFTWSDNEKESGVYHGTTYYDIQFFDDSEPVNARRGSRGPMRRPGIGKVISPPLRRKQFNMGKRVNNPKRSKKINPTLPKTKMNSLFKKRPQKESLKKQRKRPGKGKVISPPLRRKQFNMGKRVNNPKRAKK